MKLTPALALFALAAPALAQTAKPPVHRSTTATHRATTGACADMPILGEGIPKLAGCPKTLYALKYIDTVIGTGPLAMPMKLYTVHYTGYLTNGTKFDSSVDRKDPIIFPAGAHRVITGWDTGFEGMHVGGKRRLFIPYELAYGDAGKPPTIPAKSTLVFDVELIAQADFPQQPPPQPQAPRPATPPAQPATPPTATPPPASTKPAPDGAKPATVPGADPTKPTTVTPPSTSTPPPTTSKP
jgi:peptidylprolyl isomerase